MDQYAVVGNPISHSKSPLIHTRFAADTGQMLEYTAIQAPLDAFAQTVTDFFQRGGKGLNVTVPFKEQAWALCQHRSAGAQMAGAVNTLYSNAVGEICGDNTDGPGLLCDLTVNHGLSLTGKRILVVGAGGAVRGVLLPLLAQHPARLVLANRTVSKAEELAQLFAEEGQIDACGFSELSGCFDVIINGTSASLAGDLPPLPESAVASHTVVYDMMYSAQTTPFNRWALACGAAQAIDGLGMLVEQAAEAFEIWRGVRPDTSNVLTNLRNL